jgi:hypothetical protein
MTVDFGTDLALDADLDLTADGGLVDGDDLMRQVAQIRLSTPRGSVIDAPDDGIDLVEWLSRAMGPDEIASLEGTIEAELLKDERFTSARAIVDASTVLSDGIMVVELELATANGPFEMVLGVSAAGVKILGGA